MKLKTLLLIVAILYPSAKENANTGVYEAKNTKITKQMTTAKKVTKIPKYKQTFLNVLVPIIKLEEYRGVFTSVVLAQAALESGWLREYPKETNNIFGIFDYDKIQTYSTMNACITDHSFLLAEYQRYQPVRQSKTWQEQCDQLQKCGYAEDPNYSNKLKSIIKYNKLYQYDN